MKRWLITLLLLAVAAPASAWWQSRDSNYNQNIVAAGGAYSGPGDVVSGAWGFYSCRAYSLAKAGTKAYRIVRASDSAETDVNSLASGLCDTSTPTTFCNATTCKYVTFYDQTGSLACSGGTACDVTQASDAARWSVNLTALNGSPCASSSTSTLVMTSSSLTSAQAQPVTYVALAERTANFTSVGRIITQVSADVPRFSFNNAANGVAANAGTSVTAVSTDSAFNALQVIFNGASSIIVVDSSATTGLNPGATGLTAVGIQLGSAGTGPPGALVCEFAVYPSGFNATQYGNMNTNMHSAANGWNF